MEQSLSFPGLGIDLTINRVAFSFGGFNIYWYGIIIALAFALGTAYLMWRAKEFRLDPDHISTALLFCTVGSIIGARLYYVIFTWEHYSADPIRIFYIRDGGLGIYGALIGAVLVAYFVCRHYKMSFLRSMDLTSAALLLGQGIGRWGNFFNIEAFGTNTSLPWGMTSPVIQNYLTANLESLNSAGMGIVPKMPVHPTFLYESIWCILGAVLLMLFTKRRRYDGQLFLLYLTWYSFGRFFIEGLRTDSLMLGSFRVSQLLAALLFLICGALLIKNKDKRFAPEEENTASTEGETVTSKEALQEGEAFPAEENIEESGEPAAPQENIDEDGEKDDGEDH